MIKCVSLRVLELENVNINEKVLDNFLSTCKLLEEIKLIFCNGFKTIKFKNLPRLCELELRSDRDEEDAEEKEKDVFEIDNVPRLRMFRYSRIFENRLLFIPGSLGGVVTHLYITGVIFDHTLLHLIKSDLHFLEDLTLSIGSWWGPKSLVISNDSLKRLYLKLEVKRSIDVQVYAPKLLSLEYQGDQMIPSFLFPKIAPEHIEFRLYVTEATDISFFLKIRELLKLSSKFDIHIIQVKQDPLLPLNTAIDDLRKRVLFPAATNVQQLSLTYFVNENMSLDAFFTICHPGYMKASQSASQSDNNCFSKQMVTRMMEKKTNHLEDVQLFNHCDGNWESLTSSWTSVLDKLPNPYYIQFKLNWFSQ